MGREPNNLIVVLVWHIQQCEFVGIVIDAEDVDELQLNIV
jgi:hypothetical protein